MFCLLFAKQIVAQKYDFPPRYSNNRRLFWRLGEKSPLVWARAAAIGYFCAVTKSARMILQQLSIANYRNIEQAELALSPNVNCFVGANGMGKSNVLDAVYYLAFCRGFAAAQDALNVRHDADYFMLDAAFLLPGGASRRVVCSLKRGSRKRLRIDGKDVRRLSEHIGCVPLVMIAPADASLITGGSEERRRFMDMTVMQYDALYLEALIRYERTLKQRNALLKDEKEPDAAVMEVLEGMMERDAECIYAARRDFAERFLPLYRRMYLRLSGAEGEEVSAEYVSHCARGPLAPQLAECRAKERIVGYTLHGVHKDELELTLNGYGLRREASQGQQKTCLIALKLAQYLFLKEQGAERMPLLLLDDIFDKLDAERVARIVDYVGGDDFGQIFITDTRREHLDRILTLTRRSYKLFDVEHGRVTERASN